jgi:2'-5' RNA ligase
MPFAVTMRLDDGAADRIRKMWLNLSRIGLALDCLVPRNEPHVTLAVLESYDDVEELRSIVVSFAPGLSQVTLEFHAIGVYLGLGSALCLLATPNIAMLKMQEKLVRQLRNGRVGLHYTAGNWTPHVTLSREIHQVELIAKGIEMLAGTWEPLVCVARRLELVRYLPVSVLETVPLASTPPSTKDTL